MIPFAHTFYLPHNNKLKIITVKYILTQILCQQKIIPLENIELTYEPNKRYLFFLKDQFGDYHYTESPNHYTIHCKKMNMDFNCQNWFHFLKQLIYYSSLHLKQTAFYKILIKFHQDEKNKVKKSIRSMDKLLKNRHITKEMLFQWFPYKSIFLFPENYNALLENFSEGYKKIFEQIEKKNQHEYIATKIYDIFSYYRKDLDRAFLEKNDTTFEQIALEFKKEVHILLDGRFSFVCTKQIFFKKWLKSIYLFDVCCEPSSFDVFESVQKLNLIFYLFQDLSQSHVDKIIVKGVDESKKLNMNHLEQVHPMLRGSYRDYILT